MNVLTSPKLKPSIQFAGESIVLWSEFDIKLKDKLTVEIATDVADPCKHTAYVTAKSVEDFKLVEEWARKEVLPLRNKFAPKNNTFTCELDTSFEFGGG